MDLAGAIESVEPDVCGDGMVAGLGPFWYPARVLASACGRRVMMRRPGVRAGS
jgi:hypothetical protein